MVEVATTASSSNATVETDTRPKGAFQAKSLGEWLRARVVEMPERTRFEGFRDQPVGATARIGATKLDPQAQERNLQRAP